MLDGARFLIGCAAAVVATAGCAHVAAPGASSPMAGTSLGVVETDEWYKDDAGDVVVPRPGPLAVTQSQRDGFAAACDSLTIVGVDIMADGRLAGISIECGNALGLAPGQSITCHSIAFNTVTGKVVVDMGDAEEACCQMKVEQSGGLTRLSCSGSCDDGSSCAVQSGTEGDIQVFTCGCPAET